MKYAELMKLVPDVAIDAPDVETMRRAICANLHIIALAAIRDAMLTRATDSLEYRAYQSGVVDTLVMISEIIRKAELNKNPGSRKPIELDELRADLMSALKLDMPNG